MLITTTVVGLSMARKRLLGEKIATSSSLKDIAKLTLGVTASSMLVRYAQSKKWVPEDPFKTAKID